MKIIRYNVCLKRLDVMQLEMLRYWRNSTYISQYMEYKEHITSDMQKEWFYKINNIDNFFFIIEYDNVPLGLINTSNINRKDGVADTGLFVWDEKYISSPIPVLASLSMLDVFFKIFGIVKVFAKVKNDNDRAIKYNASLGFNLVDTKDENEFRLYELSSDYYFRHAAPLRKSAERLYHNTTEIQCDTTDKLSSEIFEIIRKASESNKQEIGLV